MTPASGETPPNKAVVAPEKAPLPHYSGHRARLRDRFLANPDGLPDYELLELLLFQANPRGDVKPLAKALLATFGSFARVISASPEALRRVDGVGDAAVAALKTAEASAHRLLKGEVMNQPVLGAWDRVLDYCHATMDHRPIEQFRVLFLDNRNRLIADELQQTGTINHTPVYPREVARRALELHAAAIIMVHNHPSGDPAPSAADQDMTLQVRDALRAVGVGLHDHIVVARGGHVSFRSQGLF
ncbi:RadC family protein [Rhodospirillum rubrum]|uniref:DNA repair protein RadC n=1 Tax=Rhodospirillum rubrum (strain ATCC 11170 / ATH 1.1.1 / DSM 467 / LMG 4362 / NCIMB 8255 / S1) TaxID=269796 RepID=Q2RWF9_RHORT|nr:DNA repair protein RadC [Rhodospirillum rubrum]ABC21536.1 DNA repair protein RadC [Rhodospirillum rubrum ATCC 11170]AEO47221.1 DNA repair protein RadC [Rhodospirillum rubrum F11]MBK5953158.1 DNA repair protein RadC [Rhodospirillum rubrum]QXG81208.1 DNA repair protein RadC [Rhodospirillum rubrum]HAQ00368.1 JAB domain-containing protein [Rhodospirillum rubrum]